jgi:hypothetical protein
MQILLYLGFHPTIYGKLAAFAIAKFFQKNCCPGNGSIGKRYGHGNFCFSVIE